MELERTTGCSRNPNKRKKGGVKTDYKLQYLALSVKIASIFFLLFSSLSYLLSPSLLPTIFLQLGSFFIYFSFIPLDSVYVVPLLQLAVISFSVFLPDFVILLYFYIFLSPFCFIPPSIFHPIKHYQPFTGCCITSGIENGGGGDLKIKGMSLFTHLYLSPSYNFFRSVPSLPRQRFLFFDHDDYKAHYKLCQPFKQNCRKTAVAYLKIPYRCQPGGSGQQQ
jgi:hypothetical protein